jgi:hypothetical protein
LSIRNIPFLRHQLVSQQVTGFQGVAQFLSGEWLNSSPARPAEARQRAADLRKQKDEAYVAWEEAHAELIAATRQAVEAVSEAEEKLRQLTLEAYQATGNKTPAPGVSIREVTRLSYDPKQALAWGFEHGLGLKLDTAAFEKLAKIQPPPFVTVEQVPQATIAQDLSKAVTA